MTAFLITLAVVFGISFVARTALAFKGDPVVNTFTPGQMAFRAFFAFVFFVWALALLGVRFL